MQNSNVTGTKLSEHASPLHWEFAAIVSYINLFHFCLKEINGQIFPKTADNTNCL